MQKCPTSVSIISWWLIISVVVTLTVNIRTRSDPRVIEMMSKSAIPVAVQLTWLYAGALVSLASGIGMLKRQNWARYTQPFTFFLFRPKANEYFTLRLP